MKNNNANVQMPIKHFVLHYEFLVQNEDNRTKNSLDEDENNNNMVSYLFMDESELI